MKDGGEDLPVCGRKIQLTSPNGMVDRKSKGQVEATKMKSPVDNNSNEENEY